LCPPARESKNGPVRRPSAILGSAVFLVIAPGIVAGLLPWGISRWRMEPPFFGFLPFRALGVVLIAAGLPALLDSFTRFAVQGLGTPSPAFPTERLVVTGLYRWVRNPMYVSVVSLIVGQALLLGCARLLGYAAIVALAFHLFVLLFEEPTLRAKYGAEYERYRANVRRWIPRLRPWGA